MCICMSACRHLKKHGPVAPLESLPQLHHWKPYVDILRNTVQLHHWKAYPGFWAESPSKPGLPNKPYVYLYVCM
jgi:hypothetical protein